MAYGPIFGSGASGKKRMQPSEANVAARMEDTWWKNTKAIKIKGFQGSAF